MAFAGGIDGTGGVFTGTGTPTVTTIADEGLGIPDINNNGTVAFYARFGATEGIFTGNGGPITTIADTSDPFTGFLASLADGREVIVRADPVAASVPEPSGLGFLAVGIIGLSILRRQQSAPSR